MVRDREAKINGHPLSATREHLVPKSLGGGGRTNLVIACKDCNNRRGADMTWVAFRVHGGDLELMPERQRRVFERRAGGEAA